MENFQTLGSIPNNSDFHEELLSSVSVFDGKLLKVHCDQVRLRDGTSAEREWLEHPGAVVIIAELTDGKLLMEHQYRYPLARVMLEFPAGKIEKQEAPLLTALRELREETGYSAKHWHYLGTMHPSIGYSNERIEIFLARGLQFVGAELDVGEFLTVSSLSISAAVDAIHTGLITDGKTIAALFWAQNILSGIWALPEEAHDASR